MRNRCAYAQEGVSLYEPNPVASKLRSNRARYQLLPFRCCGNQRRESAVFAPLRVGSPSDGDALQFLLDAVSTIGAVLL